MTRRAAYAALGAVGLAAAVLLAVELARGAWAYGDDETVDPCVAQPSYPGDGLDATVQRVVLDGLNGAACELGTTREELVLALDPALAPEEIRWDAATIERALRSGLLRAVEDAERRGELNALTARVLREVIARAPIAFLVEGGSDVAGIIEDLRDLDLGELLERLDDLDLGGFLDDLLDGL
ncbi:MAG TPA: hypothetical protein VK915_11250 [Gaiellaceae bacterium]|nr:hypothetical protein [Gaiellaceae bacterium]